MKYPISESMHEAIRELYLDETGRGQVKSFAYNLGLPRWKVSRYAIQQGWIAKQHKEPNWNERELKILEFYAHLTPEIIQKKLRKEGYQRSATAIVLKRKRGRFLNGLRGQSATSLALCFGVDSHYVTDRINNGNIKAEHRGTKRTERQGGDHWFIKDKDIKNYIMDNVHEIDFRKIDKYWLVGVLTKENTKNVLDVSKQDTSRRITVKPSNLKKCLKCDAEFISEGKFNRICPNCKEHGATYHPTIFSIVK